MPAALKWLFGQIRGYEDERRDMKRLLPSCNLVGANEARCDD
jgi:hypothetical protein